MPYDDHSFNLTSWYATTHGSSSKTKALAAQGSHLLLYIRLTEFVVLLRPMSGLASHASTNGRDRIQCKMADATLRMSQALLHGAGCATRWLRQYTYTSTSRCTRTVTSSVNLSICYLSLSFASVLCTFDGLSSKSPLSLPFARIRSLIHNEILYPNSSLVAGWVSLSCCSSSSCHRA